MRRRIALLLALAVGLAGCTFGKASDRHGFRPTYQPVACPAEIAAILLTDHSCGTLTVPAHHSDPDHGRLRLFVVRIQPGTSQPAPDPVLSLGGDLGVAPDYVTLGIQAAGLGREVIVLNGRGTGRSEPNLGCPEVDALPDSPMQVRVDDPRTRSQLLEAISACRDRLVSQGVDLSAFDLREIAADAEDLRAALGIDRWNLLALGTTSRIALEYLRGRSDHVRAAVLDGPEWPGVDPFIESVQATRHAIAELVAACGRDPACRRLAPRLGHDLETVLQRLHAKPFVADFGEKGRVYFDAGWLLVWLRARLSFLRPPGTYVPHAIAEFAQDSDRVLRMQAFRLLGGESASLGQQLCQGFLPNCWTQLVRSFGLYLSVMCRDVVPFTDSSSLRDLVNGDPAFEEAYGHSPFLGACSVWDAGRGDPIVATPVRSDVPVLVIVGRFDPFGMFPYAAQGTATLPNSSVLVSPVNGHVATGTEQEIPQFCMVRIRDAWLSNPTSKPDTSCIHRLRIDYSLALDWKL
jgi:pimeloyl-ACP methyl ester carboxylesterase